MDTCGAREESLLARNMDKCVTNSVSDRKWIFGLWEQGTQSKSNFMSLSTQAQGFLPQCESELWPLSSLKGIKNKVITYLLTR